MRRFRGWRRAVLPGVALGIGAGALATTLAFVDYLTIRQPSLVREPDRVFSLPTVFNSRTYQHLHGVLQHLEVAGYRRAQAEVADERRAAWWPAVLECGTPNYFDVLALPIGRGRAWTSPADDFEHVIVVGERFWHQRLGSRPDVLGTPLTVNGIVYRIIGVSPAGYSGLRVEPADLFVPIEADPEVCLHRGRELLDSGNWLTAMGRLRSGSTLSAAASELAAHGEEGRALLVPLPQARLGTIAQDVKASRLGVVAAGALLLLAVCNVVGLQALRGLDRRDEVAIRLQLGATR